MVKGKKLPDQCACRLEIRREQESAGSRWLPQCDQELALLTAAWERARVGNGQMVELPPKPAWGRAAWSKNS